MDCRLKGAPDKPHKVATRTYMVTASDETKDRYGDVILVDGTLNGKRYGKGWQLDAYRTNPVLLAFHQSKAPAVGSVDVWRDEQRRRLMARVKFADTTLGRELDQLYDQEVMRAFSVGFQPVRDRVFQPSSDAERSAWGLGPHGMLFAEQELLELSAVAIPANPAALVDNEAKGYGRLADVMAAEGLRDAAHEIRSALPSGRTTFDLGAFMEAEREVLRGLEAAAREDEVDRAFASLRTVNDLIREEVDRRRNA